MDPEAQSGICPPITAITPSTGQVASVGSLSITLTLKTKADKKCTTANVTYQMFKTTSAGTGPAASLAASPASGSPSPIGPPVHQAVPIPVGADKIKTVIPVKNTSGKPAKLVVTASTDTPPAVTATYDVAP